MTHVAYKGPADLRTLSAADLKKAGVENFSKTSFPLGDPVEVEDAVGEALLNHQLFSGQFTEVEEDEELGQRELNFEGDENANEEAKAAAGGHAQTSTGADSVTTTSSSTSGSTTGGTTGTTSGGSTRASGRTRKSAT